MTDDELKELVASLAVSQKETDKQLKETDRQLTRQISKLGEQIGGLGRKFGSFTEGLALPSMQHILQDEFHMEIISPSVRVRKGGGEMEIDVLAYANSTTNEVYVVEVKSHLKEDGITQLQNIMKNFRRFFPEHKDKKLFAILAAVDMSTHLKNKILSLGFYAASIKEDIFSLDVPSDFTAKSY